MKDYYQLIVIYLALVNIISFSLMAIDKKLAKRHSRRIKEKTLLLWDILGGSVGGLLAMKLFHHKTLHKKFSIGIPMILIIQLLLIGYFIK